MLEKNNYPKTNFSINLNNEILCDNKHKHDVRNQQTTLIRFQSIPHDEQPNTVYKSITYTGTSIYLDFPRKWQKFDKTKKARKS